MVRKNNNLSELSNHLTILINTAKDEYWPFDFDLDEMNNYATQLNTEVYQDELGKLGEIYKITKEIVAEAYPDIKWGGRS